MAEHTPGPWRQAHDYIEAVPDGEGYAAPSFDICAMADWCGEDEDERLANARLIAAAPDMLKALREVVACADSSRNTTFGAVVKCRIAIAKAEGAE